MVKVGDGDTVTVLDQGNRQWKVRLAGIDAPEKGQPFGECSKQHLAALVFQHDVRVEWKMRDRYQRVVGTVWVAPHDCAPDCRERTDASLAQVVGGLAWHYKKYEKEQSPEARVRYAEAEMGARQQRIGLWQDAQPIPPWQWRHRTKNSRTIVRE